MADKKKKSAKETLEKDLAKVEKKIKETEEKLMDHKSKKKRLEKKIDKK